MTAPDRSVRPTRTELHAWRTFLRAHARVTRVLEAELVAEQQLSLGGYDVLVQLAEAPDHRLRMAELADAVLLSRSGVTRLVDRLERAGMVARERVPGDGRGVVATLTAHGLDVLRTASRTHLAGVSEHFVARLSAEQLAYLGELCGKLAD
ncbi:MarR family winged helix-turn-helix transcriptional regulator [Actinokineospora spheciospongiae]|uniref:MarR family winged helix-turn-helix transcriptional regulator n=1 Tax=Actinokineospora spheciospongiae TaxID=909613 RepID=UPI00054DFC4C|nr:MarR family transcriptional regulator [Actinokineospora spheciospongiae]PWW65369.1 MarR family transcriptional regulator [Actinokineospora spheciospongiae]